MFPTQQPPKRFLHQGGLRAVAEALFQNYGHSITCPQCQVSEPKPWRAYHLNEGGNAGNNFKRRQFRCRNAGEQFSKTGYRCPTKPCKAYIERACETIGEREVEKVRRLMRQRLHDRGEPCENIRNPFTSKKGLEPSYEEELDEEASPEVRPEKVVKAGGVVVVEKEEEDVVVLKKRDPNRPTVLERKEVSTRKAPLAKQQGALRPTLPASEETEKVKSVARALKRRHLELTREEERAAKRQATSSSLPAKPKPIPFPISPARLQKAYEQVTEVRELLLEGWRRTLLFQNPSPVEIPNSTSSSHALPQSPPWETVECVDLAALSSPFSDALLLDSPASNIIVARPATKASKLATTGVGETSSPPLRRNLFRELERAKKDGPQ